MCSNRSKSSGAWLNHHYSDNFFKKAVDEGYLARSVYKLKEMSDKNRILKNGMLVLELGAAPGSWTQFISEKIREHGMVIAIDIEPLMYSSSNIEYVCSNVFEGNLIDRISDIARDRKIDIVLSDMSPKLTGIKEQDQVRMLNLVNRVLEISLLLGIRQMLIKCFIGSKFDRMRKCIEDIFQEIKILKPNASDKKSNEVYIYSHF